MNTTCTSLKMYSGLGTKDWQVYTANELAGNADMYNVADKHTDPHTLSAEYVCMWRAAELHRPGLNETFRNGEGYLSAGIPQS